MGYCRKTFSRAQCGLSNLIYPGAQLNTQQLLKASLATTLIYLLAACGGRDGISTYNLGATISCLSSDDLTLQNNRTDDLAVSADGVVTFATPVAQNAQITVYFAQPHSAWEQDFNQNTNGFLRQYLLKGADLSIYTQEDLGASIAWQLNTGPRKSLSWRARAALFLPEGAFNAKTYWGYKFGITNPIALGV